MFLLHVHARIHVVKAQRVAASLSLECVELTDELVSPKEFSFAFLSLRFCRCQFVRTCHLKDVA